MFIGTETKDYLSINFGLCYEIEDICDFRFKVGVRVDVFTYENNEVWISHDELAKFIEDLQKLNSLMQGKAEVRSEDDNFQFSIESYGNHGYLLVRAFIRYETECYFQLHSTYNTFDGGFFVEPAHLSEWLAELIKIVTEKEPSTDFLGNWNTTLPIPKRLRSRKSS